MAPWLALGTALYWRVTPKYWTKATIVNPQQWRIFSEDKKVSESDYWFRVLIINLFVPLRLLIKPQVDTAWMFHNVEIITNNFWREGGVVADQAFNDEEERKKTQIDQGA